VFPVMDERLQHSLLRILATQLRDNVNTWVLHSDDTYTPIVPAQGEQVIDSHQVFMHKSVGLDELPDGISAP